MLRARRMAKKINESAEAYIRCTLIVITRAMQHAYIGAVVKVVGLNYAFVGRFCSLDAASGVLHLPFKFNAASLCPAGERLMTGNL